MWPNSALADLVRSETHETAIEYTMDEYSDYLQSKGCKLSKWSLDCIANHIETPDPDVRKILEYMRDTPWSDLFDEMHGYLSQEYGPELADMFNLYFFCEGLRLGRAV